MLLAVAAVALSACGTKSSAIPPSAPTTVALPAPVTAAPSAPVPAKYQAMFDQTSRDLDAYAAAITAMPTYSTSAASQVGFGELLDANGNRQGELLMPAAMTGVDQSLDAFKRLGVRGVVVGVKLPLLLPTYTPQAGQYADFWSAVADHARARGFTVDVELGPLFCGTTYSQCSYHYPTTVVGWADLTAQQARTVLDQIHPDYLDLLSEPNTEANLTGIRELQSVTGVTDFVKEALARIGAHGDTKLLAGAASWFGPVYDEAIARTGVDGLVTHIYPANASTAANLVATARVAHDANLPFIADEVWLYKGTTTAAGNVQASNGEGFLNTFSFWEPLDVRFMQATRQWAAKAGSTLLSGFWSWQTQAYLTWTPALDATPIARVLLDSAAAAASAMTAVTFTQTGLALVGR